MGPEKLKRPGQPKSSAKKSILLLAFFTVLVKIEL
jgi:hypothetical protein